jgi:hypothetical protein
MFLVAPDEATIVVASHWLSVKTVLNALQKATVWIENRHKTAKNVTN